MRHLYLWVLVIVAVVMGMILWSAGGSRVKDEIPYYVKSVIKESARVKIGAKIFKVEVARTPAAKARGLSGREYLAPDKGMLFVFPEKSQYSFTMKETKISLDIAWILDNKIVFVKSGAQPGELSIEPNEMANYVIEVGRGVGSSWRVGDIVEITFDK